MARVPGTIAKRHCANISADLATGRKPFDILNVETRSDHADSDYTLPLNMPVCQIDLAVTCYHTFANCLGSPTPIGS